MCACTGDCGWRQCKSSKRKTGKACKDQPHESAQLHFHWWGEVILDFFFLGGGGLSGMRKTSVKVCGVCGEWSHGAQTQLRTVSSVIQICNLQGVAHARHNNVLEMQV